jgi:hypothetical protein
MVIYSFSTVPYLDGEDEADGKKHVRVSPHMNDVTMESHSDGQDDGYFLRTL